MCRYIGNQEEKEELRKQILQSSRSFFILVTTYSCFSLTFDYSNTYLFVVTRYLKENPWQKIEISSIHSIMTFLFSMKVIVLKTVLQNVSQYSLHHSFISLYYMLEISQSEKRSQVFTFWNTDTK